MKKLSLSLMLNVSLALMLALSLIYPQSVAVSFVATWAILAKALANGNELMSRNFGAKFGLLEAGYKADLTICDYNSPTPLLADNIAGHIAFGMGSGSVHSVMVNGVMVYEDRQFNFDCDSIYAQARKAAASMWRRMDALA